MRSGTDRAACASARPSTKWFGQNQIARGPMLEEANEGPPGGGEASVSKINPEPKPEPDPEPDTKVVFDYLCAARFPRSRSLAHRRLARGFPEPMVDVASHASNLHCETTVGCKDAWTQNAKRSTCPSQCILRRLVVVPDAQPHQDGRSRQLDA